MRTLPGVRSEIAVKEAFDDAERKLDADRKAKALAAEAKSRPPVQVRTFEC